MSQPDSATPQAALLRVLITGESDGSELMRKIRDWTQGRIDLDASAFEAAVRELVDSGLVERRAGAPDKRTGQAHDTFALTEAGHASAVEILAESLTRKS
jgi:DNA-binding PadR family transcriptional regulator